MLKLRLPQGSRYTTQATADGSTRIEIVPATQFDWLRSILWCAVLGGGVVGAFSEGFGQGLAALIFGGGTLVALWALALKLAPWNRGRRLSSLIVSSRGIQLGDGTRIDREDVADMSLISPQATQTVFHTGWTSAGPITGMSIKPGLAGYLAARSWRLELVARGRKHVLAGGMDADTAKSVVHEIEKAMKG